MSEQPPDPPPTRADPATAPPAAGTRADGTDDPPADPADPPPTRADPATAPPAAGTRADGTDDPPADPADPPPTRADPATTPPAAGTRADGTDDPPAGEADPGRPFQVCQLPPQLDERYEQVGTLTGGGQAALLVCRRRGGGDEVVVKMYHHARPGIEDVWALWQEAGDDPHVAALVEEPFVLGGHSYEVTRLLSAGSLDRRVGGPHGPLRGAMLETLLGQVAGTLEHIHRGLSRMLVHRDIKPSNLLVASWDPLDVRLTDFGIAVAQTHTFESRQTHSRTAAYAAPEAASQSTPQQDWWSLGISLVELYQGRHPFYDAASGQWLSDGTIETRVRTERVPLDEDIEPRWAALFRGLLTRNPAHRWGYREIQAWLEGEPVAVHEEDDEPERVAGGRPFVFAGELLHHPAELAAAIADGHWREAGELVLGPPQWRDLRDWAAAVGIGRRIEELHTSFVEPGRNVHRAVAELLVALDRSCYPVFRDRDADPAALAQLAFEAGDGSDPVRRARALEDVGLLFDSGALRALAALDGWSELARVDDRWRRWCTRVPQLAAEVLPEGAELPAVDTARFLLLAGAADPASATALEGRAAELRTRRTMRVAWFRRLAGLAHGDDATPVHVTMLLCAALVDDENLRIRPETRERVDRLVRETFPQRLQQARAQGRRSWRQVMGSGPLAAGAAGYVGLVAVAGVGVTAATTVLQGALTASVLLAAGIALFVGMSFPRRRFTDALLTGWAAAWVGLPAGAGLGALVGLLVGPEAGWSTFWSAWIVVIATGALLGTAQ